MERKRYRDVRRLHAVSIPIFLLLGTLACALMLLGSAPFLAFINRADQNALPAVYVLAPAVFFGSLSAIYRGYYEGLGDMRPTAFSEVAEALCKLILGLLTAWAVMDRAMEEFASSGTVFGQAVSSMDYARSAALPWAAAGAILGVTVGSVISLLTLWVYHRVQGDGITQEQLRASPAPARRRILVRSLIRTAIPVALGALAVNLSSLVDTAFLQNRISTVMTEHAGVLLGHVRRLSSPGGYCAGKSADSAVWMLYQCPDAFYAGSRTDAGVRRVGAAQRNGGLDEREPAQA